VGFFSYANKTPATVANATSLAFFHEHECRACPLNTDHSLKHPKMAPTGSEHPLVYILGSSPNETEDSRGKHFVGRSGQLLHDHIPHNMEDKIRWGNVIRCHTQKDRDPKLAEIESCRPFNTNDIEKSKPKAIFAFGNAPLYWMIGHNGISKWRGKRIPVQVGSHRCWLFPMLHPSYILDLRRKFQKPTDKYGSDTEFAFVLDLRQAFEQLESLPDPIIHTEEYACKGIDFVTGARGQRDIDTVLNFMQEAAQEKVVGLDYETSCLRPYEDGARIITVALASSKGALAFPLYHRESRWTNQALQIVIKAYEDFLYDAPCRKISHKLDFELEWSAYFFGKECVRSGKWGDSLSQAFVRDEREGVHSLDFLCLQHFGFNLKAISNLDTKHLDEAPIDLVLKYNALDSIYHRRLYVKQMGFLINEKLADVYVSNVRRIQALILTTMKGIPVDQKKVQEYFSHYDGNLKAIEAEIAKLPEAIKFKQMKGCVYRPSAPQDTAYVLDHILHVEHSNADVSTLSSIKNPLMDLTIKWRQANKILSTYVKPNMIESPVLFPDGMLHPSFNTTIVRTWRTSSSGPNVQNYPMRVKGAKDIRAQISAGPGYKIVSADFAGIQARNVAMESRDKRLVEAFWNHYDIHTDWMLRILKAFPKWVPGGLKAVDKDKDLRKDLRYKAKNRFVFPTFFGAQPRSIAANLKIPEELITEVQNEFLQKEFSGVKKWQDNITADYFKTGYVTGLSGFRRHAPISPNELINSPIQSDEALLVCEALGRLSELDDDLYQPILEVHDDLSFCLETKKVDANLEVIITEMLRITHPWQNVPMGVEVKIGDNWADMEVIGEFESTADGGWTELKK
jgi:uracil-DNA glycosylase family 4